MTPSSSAIRRALLATFFLVALLAFALYALGTRIASLWNPGNVPEATFVLKKGESPTALFGRIRETGRDTPVLVLKLYTRFMEFDRKIKAGRYRIPGDWSPARILEQATLGGNDPFKVTLPPGLALPQIAMRLEQAGWVESATAWIALASGPTALDKVGVANYEGLIAPETYFFDASESPERVLETLHAEWKRRMVAVAGSVELGKPMRNGLNLYDTLILASVVEKEAAKEIERATVSSVFHNRIRKGWPLGSAATLRYAVGDWTGSDRNLPVNLKSPYNTSRKPGLPPTPICLPSIGSLRAALDPPETDYFFFVADGAGGLIFNRTHEEHRVSVSAYRKQFEPGN